MGGTYTIYCKKKLSVMKRVIFMLPNALLEVFKADFFNLCVLWTILTEKNT